MECSPGISDDNDSISLALHEHSMNGFSIHAVPYDGIVCLVPYHTSFNLPV